MSKTMGENTHHPSLDPGVGAVIQHVEVTLSADHWGDADFLNLRYVERH